MPQDIKYQPVENEDEDDGLVPQSLVPQNLLFSQKSKQRTTRFWFMLIAFAAVTSAVISGSACFLWGRNVERWRVEDDWFAPPGQIGHTFTYRREFGLRPGNQSQVWWDRVFPKGRGFVQHPEISPEPAGLAVFHQLHCLDALRHGYWAALDNKVPDHLARPGHIRHCIDYLRQSIMCHADTNLEPINASLGGVTGYGFERKCRDIVRLIGWAAKWRTHNQSNHEIFRNGE